MEGAGSPSYSIAMEGAEPAALLGCGCGWVLWGLVNQPGWETPEAQNLLKCQTGGVTTPCFFCNKKLHLCEPRLSELPNG